MTPATITAPIEKRWIAGCQYPTDGALREFAVDRRTIRTPFCARYSFAITALSHGPLFWRRADAAHIAIKALGVGGRISKADRSATVLPPLAYFRSKRSFGFCCSFAQKWDRPDPGDLDMLASLQTARPATAESVGRFANKSGSAYPAFALPERLATDKGMPTDDIDFT